MSVCLVMQTDAPSYWFFFRRCVVDAVWRHVTDRSYNAAALEQAGKGEWWRRGVATHIFLFTHAGFPTLQLFYTVWLHPIFLSAKVAMKNCARKRKLAVMSRKTSGRRDGDSFPCFFTSQAEVRAKYSTTQGKHWQPPCVLDARQKTTTDPHHLRIHYLYLVRLAIRVQQAKVRGTSKHRIHLRACSPKATTNKGLLFLDMTTFTMDIWKPYMQREEWTSIATPCWVRHKRRLFRASAGSPTWSVSRSPSSRVATSFITKNTRLIRNMLYNRRLCLLIYNWVKIWSFKKKVFLSSLIYSL